MKLDSWTAKPMTSHRAARKGFDRGSGWRSSRGASNCHVGAARVLGPEQDKAQQQKGENPLSAPPSRNPLYVTATDRRNERGGQQVKDHGAGELRKAGQVHDGAGEPATNKAELDVVEANRRRLVKQRPVVDDLPSAPASFTRRRVDATINTGKRSVAGQLSAQPASSGRDSTFNL